MHCWVLANSETMCIHFSIKGNETEVERTVKGSKLSASRRESIVNFDCASPLEYLIFMVSTSCLKLKVQE